MSLARGFSRQHRITHFAPIGSASGLSLNERGFAYTPAYTAYPGTTTARAGLPSCVTPSLTYYPLRSPAPPRPIARRLRAGFSGFSITRFGPWRSTAGTGISTRCPSTTPVGLALGPDSPWADQPGPGTLGHSAPRVSHAWIRYSCLHSHSCTVHDWLTPPLHPMHDAPLPIPHLAPRLGDGFMMYDTTSAVYLSPATLSARNHLTSELLRTLSRVAASKPTSWLSLRPTSFPT